MGRLKNALELLASCLISSLIVTSLDFLVVYLSTQQLSQLFSKVTFVLLIEGGLGLILGGGTAMYSPVLSKVGEIMFKSEPWNAKRKKEAEKQGHEFILVGVFLLVIGLLVSAIWIY
jgi:hypothetical protein